MKAIWKTVCIVLILAPALFAQNQQEEPDPSLVAVGSLSASNLYLSYLVLGTVRDGYVNGSYDLEATLSIALETIFLNENSRLALEGLLESGVVAPEESLVVMGMIQSYTMLDNMAQALVAFIRDGDDNDVAYQIFRRKAWERISRLLKL